MVGALYRQSFVLKRTFLKLVKPRSTSKVTKAYKVNLIGVNLRYIWILE